MNRLINLCLFLARKELCSNIPGIGKMKYLQRLKEYHVKKEDIGFELSELGNLTELGGKLKIFNLENVATREEANQAKLWLKRNLRTLKLIWGAVQQTTGSDVLDGLQPHSNLRALSIINHGGPTGPGWLCTDIRINGLKCLHLEGISWGTLPPFGQLMHLEELTLINIAVIRQFGPDFGGVTKNSFLHLKKIEFVRLPELVEWVGGDHCHLFSKLSSIRCEDCPNLSMLLLPSSVCSMSCTQDIKNTTWFPNLCYLIIWKRPRLSLPPLPHTSMLTCVTVREDDTDVLGFGKNELMVNSYRGALAFHNLNKVEDMTIVDMPLVSLTDLQKLNSLRSLDVKQCESMLFSEVDEGVIFHSVHKLNLRDFHVTGKSLTNLSNYFPALTEFRLNMSIEVEEEEETVLRVPWSSLSYFQISGYVNLFLPVEDGGGLQDLSSLQKLEIKSCGKMFARWSALEAGALSSKPFPASLRELEISKEPSMQSMDLLSNLTSLTRLELIECVNLTVDGFDPIITHNLKELEVYNSNNHHPSIAADLFSEVARMEVIPAGSFQQLEELSVDSISAVLVAPICNLLACTLRQLGFSYDLRMESFTETQQEALQLLTSLQCLGFSRCPRLQSLPEGLHRLSSLHMLQINKCPEIRALPKEGFPASLIHLFTTGTCVDLKDQLKKLEASTPDDLLIHARRKTLQHWKGEQASKRWQQRHQRQQGFAGGSAESDMHSLARESRTTGEGLAFGPAMATPVGVTFLLGRCCVFYPLPMGSPGENHFLSKTSGCGATGVVSSLEASFIRSIP
uniref:R13L1/DRL21-like LRR repeat region domain-containing protein n=1 Tax=Oryza punctata TaxID=4537 RepID=A0A0E0JY67_ORYPU